MRHFKKSDDDLLPTASPLMRYRFIYHHAATWPVRRQCQLLGVSASGYYAWAGRPAPPAAPAPAWQQAAQQLFDAHPGRYGTRRLQAALAQQQASRPAPAPTESGAVGRDRLRRWLRQSGQQALCTRPPAPRPRTTQPDATARCAPNRLAEAPAPTAPNQIWQGDITYLPLASGAWVYLAAWRDAYSRTVVGWQVSATMTTDLVLDALRRAVAVRQPAAGLLVHADRGCQYTSRPFAKYLTEHKFIASCSRTGNPYDNALVESGWSTLKTELLPRQAVFADLAEARAEVEYYLGTYYNTQRLHSAIGYRTPTQFEQLPSPPNQ
ncbi:MAG: IS3 family transposase, partial [Hymenobacteraceae bacterium]|nr:IS3 family transposase [Hymenobacteraceae bacterium]